MPMLDHDQALKRRHSTRCRSCANSPLEIVLDLGSTPLANRLLSSDQLNQPEPKFPLVLAFCSGCSLVQITETVPPEVLFRDYVYFSSFSDTMLDHARDTARRMIASAGLGPDSLVVEIASNDGYLLQYYREAGVPVLGVEPAANVAKVARETRNIPTLCEFFGPDLAGKLANSGRKADVIHANNVMAHVPDIHGFLSGIERLLKDGGVAVIEVPYVKDMIERVEFDTIYHEHLSYFSLTALDRLCKRHALFISDVERLPIHGGSLRLFVRHEFDGVSGSPGLRRTLAEEEKRGVSSAAFYRDFGCKVENLKAQLSRSLQRLRLKGARIAAYGASAKGSTLLNYFGIGRPLLDFVVDRSTAKQGLYTPGSHLPICAPQTLLDAMPDYCLLLTWNFAGEILEQQAEYTRRGGRFVIPIPEMKVL
jgi:SAM-dependent methyltransferase